MTKLNLSYANKSLEIRTMAVHDTTFHADDVFAAMLIRAIYPGLIVTRTRDSEILDKQDLVADTGFLYSFDNLRFDHHQEGKAGKRENGIEYSAFGLIWRHWGLEVCHGDYDVFEYIDKILIQPIDAQDNGQSLYGPEIFEGIEDMNLDGIMKKGFNPAVGSDEEPDEQFRLAMDFAELVFNRIFISAKSLMATKKGILDTYEQLDDKRFIIEESYRPVLAFREQMPELLFHIFPQSEKKNKWTMKCAQEDGFNNRKDLPKEWAGKNDKELEEISGIKGMLFCHNARFICAASTKDAILQALEVALSY